MGSSESANASALAITERKLNSNRSGSGCVGIFFQLFDWNRRFYKKKLFPKKLLPPARAKVSKKFNADEKLPVGRHLMIADENSGGFSSNMKKNGVGFEQKNHEVHPPGLVARLMGLEALPVTVQKDKSSKSSPSKDSKVEGGRCGGVGFDGLVLSPEKNARPQKIQKTGILEKRPITRLGAEALQIKNVLLRSRKHHHPKLASPVKSPKMGRNSSRLLDAATRILEPGIQASNRARCSLTYTNSIVQPCKEISEMKANVALQGRVFDKQPSCRGCGNLLGRMDVENDETSVGQNSSGSNFREAFFRELEESRSRPATYLEKETEVVLLKTRYPPECVTAEVDNRSVRNELIRNVTHESLQNNQIPASRMFTSQKGTSPSVVSKDITQRRSQMQPGDRVPPRSKLASMQGRRVASAINSVSQPKDFISINRNLNRTRLTVPSKPDKSDTGVEAERRFHAGKNDIATQRSPVRKRRTLNANGQASNPGSTSSLLGKQSNRGNAISPQKTSGANSVNRTYLRSRSGNQRVSKDTDVVSFSFSSPVKSRTRFPSHSEMGVKKRDQVGPSNDEGSQLNENSMKIPSQNSSRVNGDALGALLEQKLMELTHQVENEASTDFTPSTRTTATILQELISALTAEKPISHEHGPDTNESQSGSDSVDGVTQANSRIKRSSDEPSREPDHFSPGCVLDASFSNDSCNSSSTGSAPRACTDVDLLDSASSTNNPRSYNVMAVTDLLKHTAKVLQNMDLVHARLTGAKLDYVHEVILHTELAFGNAHIQNSPRFVDFLLGPFLDELENLVKAAWKDTIILGFEVKKEENSVRTFLFDCLIECLDVKYNRYSNFGYRAWSMLPKCMNADILIQVFDEEVRKWISLVGKTPDELIEREMSISLGKWTDFQIEEYETGAQISDNIVQTLVDEMMIDICGC